MEEKRAAQISTDIFRLVHQPPKNSHRKNASNQLHKLHKALIPEHYIIIFASHLPFCHLEMQNHYYRLCMRGYEVMNLKQN